MDQILISLRNLLHSYRRTLLTLSILVFGVVGMLTYAGYIDYTMWGYRESTIAGGLGHLRVFKSGYNSRGNESYLDYVIENEKETYSELLKTAHVQEVTSQLSVQGLLSNGEGSEMTVCNGYDLSSVKVIKSSYKIVEGEFITGASDEEIALGVGLAEKLDARPGSWLTFMTTTKDGALNAVDVEVKSIIKTGVSQYDTMLSIVPIALAQSLVDVDAVEKYIVMLDKTENVGKVEAHINEVSKDSGLGIETKNWFDLAEYYKKVKSMLENYYFITQCIILFIVAFSIVNTMRMVIYERMREIGTIRAIGMTRLKVILMFLYEGIWLGIVAIVAGICIAWVLAFIINVSGGIYISPPPGQSEGYNAMIRPNLVRYLEVTIIVFFSVIVGSLIPAVRASYVKIDTALRYV